MRKIDMVAQHISRRFQDWKDDRAGKEGAWNLFYRTWRCLEDGRDASRDNERSKIKIPATKEAITNAVDAITQVVFASTPWFNLEARSPRAESKAEVTKAYLDYLFLQENIEQKLYNFVTEMAIYGTAVAQIAPRPKTTKSLTTRELRDPMGVVVETQREVVEKTVIRPYFEPVSIFDFFIEPSATDIQSAEGCMVRSRKKIHELFALERAGYLKGVNMLAENSSDQSGEDVLNDDDRQNRYALTGLTLDRDSEGIEVLEYWGWLPEALLKEAGFEGEIEDGGAEVHAIVASGTYCLKLRPNPYFSRMRPFVKDCFEEVPNEFYGMGVAEVAAGPQRALDATVRSRLDNKALAINQIFGINVRKMVPGQNLKIYPGKVFLVDGNIHEALQQFTVNDVTGGSYHEAGEYERYVQSAAGISRAIGGMPTKRGEQTATEVSTLVQQSAGRIKTIVRSMENNVLIPMLRWYYSILFQFLNAPEMFRVTDDVTGMQMLLTIDQDDIVGDYDFIPQGSVAIANTAMLSKTMQFLAQTANPFDVQLVNRQYLIKKVYKAMGFKDGDLALLPPQPSPQQMMMNAAQAPNVGTAPGLQNEPPPMMAPNPAGPLG